MTSREYKLKYGLPLGQALSAKSLTMARRKIAKEKGLGEKLVAYSEEKKNNLYSLECKSAIAA